MKRTLRKSSITVLVASMVAQVTPMALTKTAVVTGAAILAMSISQNANAQGAGKSVLELDMSKKVKEPIIFHIKDSNNIILDIYGVDRGFKGIPSVENDPLIEKVLTKIVGERLRVIIKTKHAVKYQAFQSEGKIFVQLQGASEYENVNFSQVEPEVIKVTEVKVVEEVGVVPLESIQNLDNTWTEKTTRIAGLTNSERQSIIDKVNDINGTPTVKKELPLYTKLVTEENAFVELKKINLKRDAKATKVVFDLSSSSVIPEIKKSGNKLIIDLKGVSIPNELQRRIGTETLGTAVKSLDVSMQKNEGRIILEVSDKWDYSFYQMDKQFSVTVKSIAQDEQVKRYVGKPLTISFQDIDVRAVLQVIADFTNLNIMSSDQITGSMTLRLKDVPWDQALDLVLESRGLQKISEGNVIRIATNEEVEKTNDAKLKLKTQNESLEPLKLEFFQINYYKAEELKSVLEGKGKGEAGKGSEKIMLLSSRGSVGVDTRNNIILVQDTEEALKYVRNIIKKLDIPTRQVLIEAKIVLAEDSFGKELGSKFGLRGTKKNGNNAIGIGGNITESQNVAGGSLDPTTVLSGLGAAALNGFTAGAIGFTLLNLGNGNALGIELSALESANRGKVLSSPRLLTTDNRKALIEQGTEIPYVTPASGDSPPTISFKKAVLKLEVTPQITPNGRVIMDLEIRKDTIGQLVNVQGGGQVPSIDTRNMKNQITVSNGQTVVLGGVYEITNRDDLTKIPFFGDIPGLGNLFKNKSKSEEKGELLIFITPHVIEDEDLDTELNTTEITMEKK